jgi:hypothetical protein
MNTLTKIGNPLRVDPIKLFPEIRNKYNAQTCKRGRITSTREDGKLIYSIGGASVLVYESNWDIFIDASMIGFESKRELGVAA